MTLRRVGLMPTMEAPIRPCSVERTTTYGQCFLDRGVYPGQGACPGLQPPSFGRARPTVQPYTAAVIGHTDLLFMGARFHDVETTFCFYLPMICRFIYTFPLRTTHCTLTACILHLCILPLYFGRPALDTQFLISEASRRWTDRKTDFVHHGSLLHFDLIVLALRAVTWYRASAPEILTVVVSGP